MDKPDPAPPHLAVPSKSPPLDGKYQQEVAWMAALREGDEAAFLELYREFGDRVLAVCLRILHDLHIAEDVLSEVFWEIWRHPERYDSSRSTPQTYLLMVARSRAIDRLRELGRRAKTISAASALAPDIGMITPENMPEASVHRQEEKHLLRGALMNLDAAQRQVLELAFFGGLSHQEIAKQLDSPLGTVKSRIRQGLIHLRSKLSSTFPERSRP
ncbi:MAG: sigma-70 family RNA polymerase sigma factor [Bythopirellula sp.]|nr:sigma-70 family RNA polymerase sigma factor [Bythopirellula sp.]